MKEYCDDIKQCSSIAAIKKSKEIAEQIDCRTRPFLWHMTGMKEMISILSGNEVLSESEDRHGRKKSMMWTSKRPISYYAAEEEKLMVLLEIKTDKSKLCQVEGRYLEKEDGYVEKNKGYTMLPSIKEQIIDCERIKALKKCQDCDMDNDEVAMAHSDCEEEEDVLLYPKKRPWKLEKTDISAISPLFYSDATLADIKKELLKNGLDEYVSKVKVIEQYCPGTLKKVASHEEFEEKCW